jgi:hypothetical protein
MPREIFLRRFPEFRGCENAFIDGFLAAAENEVDAEVWGNKASEGVMYLAAHKMAASPFGENARLATGAGSSYLEEYRRLVRIVSSGFRVTK